jgi:hypothetical protein
MDIFMVYLVDKKRIQIYYTYWIKGSQVRHDGNVLYCVDLFVDVDVHCVSMVEVYRFVNFYGYISDRQIDWLTNRQTDR